MDTPELRRSALERKDRDELSAIAASLGVKPPSRARKAEIVDLILTAVTTDGADGEGEDADGSDAPETAADTDTSGDGADESSESEVDGDEEFDFGEVTTKPASSGRNRKKSGNKNDGDNDKGDKSDEGSGDKGQKNSGNGNNNDEPAGPGNRRQRRRGRGRDQQDQWDGEPVGVEGVLDLRDDGYGFLRVNGWRSSKDDAYVSVKQVRTHNLRKGDQIVGTSRPANRNEKNPALLSLESINGTAIDEVGARADFDELVSVHPDELLSQHRDGAENPVGRIIDLLAPIGKGGRALVAGPSGAGASSLLREVCAAVEANEPDVHLIAMLIDARPEDATDLRRAIVGEVAASNFDRPADEHVAVAEMTLERAKRLVEIGRDVVVVVDGLTALARAHQQGGGGNNRGQAVEIDATSIHMAKRFFGAARNVEDGGSLTVVASLRTDESSRTDRILAEAFPGAATSSIVLDGAVAQRGVHPAVDVMATEGRGAEALVGAERAAKMLDLRTRLAGAADEGGSLGALESLLGLLEANATDDAVLGG